MSDAFDKANEMVHPVETQWHYPILTQFDFVPDVKSAIGFVRSYTYTHPSGAKIQCNTGTCSDYWTDITKNDEGVKGAHGYWASLERHLASLNLPQL